MERIIKRLDELAALCSIDSSCSYSEIIYEIDGLALSIAGKNSEIYSNLCAIYRSNNYEHVKKSYLKGVVKSLKNEILINGIKKDERDDIINHLHELIIKSSLKKYQDGHYSDAVESAIKEINERLKTLYKKHKNEEKDGSDLFALVFNSDETKTLLKVADMTTISGKDEQDGYKFMFMGVWKGIRNPKAHANTFLSKEQAYKRLIFTSMLMEKIDEAIKFTGIVEWPNNTIPTNKNEPKFGSFYFLL